MSVPDWLGHCLCCCAVIRPGAHLLETSDHPVSEIGLVLGFSSAGYFSQRFKKAVGVTPQEYHRTVRVQLSVDRETAIT